MRDYFSHDYNARNDKKLVGLHMRHGLEGIGLYWCLVEMLYESGGVIMQSECDRIAFELRCSKELLNSVIFDFSLFIFDKKIFFSESVNFRLELRNSKSSKARDSALARWANANASNNDANALRTQCEGNAIKVKESKVKVKENKVVQEKPQKRFSKPSLLELQTYCLERKNTVDTQRFFDYYESNGWKVGKNPMKDWRASIRTWEKSDINNQKPQNGQQSISTGKSKDYSAGKEKYMRK